MNNSIEKYGITLRRLTHDKIELVRQWRNNPKISQYMEFREYITPEMQERWFKNIDNKENLFYIIVINNEEIGLINIKDIDLTSHSGEGGVFIWDDRYLNSDVSYRAHLALFDAVFENNIVSQIISHVLSDNRRAQRFTQFLGFQLAEGQDLIYNQLYILDSNTYFSNKNRERYNKKYK